MEDKSQEVMHKLQELGPTPADLDNFNIVYRAETFDSTNFHLLTKQNVETLQHSYENAKRALEKRVGFAL